MAILSGVSRDGIAMQKIMSVALMLVCLLMIGPIQAQVSAPQLSSDSDVASAGFFRLSWETAAERVELQEDTGPDFRNPITTYLGSDRAAVISGKTDGTWYYRVRALDDARAGAWSEPVTVVVEHHSLSRALMFLSIGVIVFVAIVLMIMRGPGKAE